MPALCRPFVHLALLFLKSTLTAAISVSIKLHKFLHFFSSFTATHLAMCHYYYKGTYQDIGTLRNVIVLQ